MKVKIQINDQQGNIYEGELELVKRNKRDRGIWTLENKKNIKPSKTINHVNFEMQIRAFIKKYSKDMSGHEKFTLLVAYFSKGELNKEVLLDKIEKNWNKMTSKDLMGMKFNRCHTIKAKDNDWVITIKNGVYTLRPSWREIFK